MSTEKPDQYKSVHAPYILGRGRQEVRIGGKPGKLTADQRNILVELFTRHAHETRFACTYAEIAQGTLIPRRTVERLMAGDWILDVAVTGIDASGNLATLFCKATRSKLTGQPGTWTRKPMCFEVSSEPGTRATVALAGSGTTATVAVANVGESATVATAKTARTTATVAESLEEKNSPLESSLLASLEEKGRASPATRTSESREGLDLGNSSPPVVPTAPEAPGHIGESFVARHARKEARPWLH